MDREPEELQFQGVFGIVGEAFKILRSCPKLLGAITLTLILPLSVIIVAHSLILKNLFEKIANMNEPYDTMNAAKRNLNALSWEWGEVLLLEAAYMASVFSFSLLSTVAVVYTVAGTYSDNNFSYANVTRVVARVWKRLTVTILSSLIFLSAYCVGMVFILFFWITVMGVHKSNMWVPLHRMFIICILFLIGLMYTSKGWQIAGVMSAVEERYGFARVRKRTDVVRGNRVRASRLCNLDFTVSVIVLGFSEYFVVYGDEHGLGFLARTAYGTVVLMAMCVVLLMELLTQSVVYFVCKSYHFVVLMCVIALADLLTHSVFYFVFKSYEAQKNNDVINVIF